MLSTKFWFSFLLFFFFFSNVSYLNPTIEHQKIVGTCSNKIPAVQLVIIIRVILNNLKAVNASEQRNLDFLRTTRLHKIFLHFFAKVKKIYTTRCWIGHTLRKPTTNTTRQALKWNPQGKRKRGRPRNSWRRDLEDDIKRMGRTWGQLERLAQDRAGWGNLAGGLCPRRGK